MADGDLVESLQNEGFEAVETELPGGWATDGDRTVIIYSERKPGVTTELEHRVFVLDAPASEVGVDTALLARTMDSSHELAVRRALDQAGTAEVATDE